MQFKYTATNTEGKKLTGSINAVDEATARNQLNNLGFSVLGIQQVQETTTQKPSLEKFEFEATDRNGKTIKGTIPAKNSQLAYKRLVEEYKFHVLAIVPMNASPEEKQTLRAQGVTALQQTYEAENKPKDQTQEMKSVTESPEFQEKKREVIEQVDQIIQKIKNLLIQFEGKISPEKRATIQQHLEKLLRIKSSNNLEYITNTCQTMLKTIQEEELFLQNESHDSARQSVVLESQKMALDLNKAVAKKMDASTQIKTYLAVVDQKLQGTRFHFLLDPIRTVKRWFTLPPEIARIKSQRKALRRQRIDALIIAFKSPKDAKKAAWDNLKSLQAQDKKLRQELRSIHQLQSEKRKLMRQERRLYWLEETNSFTGWLLTFYLIYYFLGHYITLNALNIEPIFGIPFDLRDSVLFKYLLGLVFVIHAATSLKFNFFLKSRLANAVLIPVTVLLSLMILFNF